MLTRKLGGDGPEVGALGLGTSGMADTGNTDADNRESIATMQAALDGGMSLLDTADFYGMGQSELLIREAIKGRREQAFIALKYGGLRDPGGAFIGFDNRPAATKNFLAYSLRRLGTDYVDLYQPSRVDPAVPIEDTVGAIADLVKGGYVRYIGLSEAGPGTIRRANAVHPITAVEVEYSLVGRDIENNVLPAVRDLNLGLIAYSVLSGGLLSGQVPKSEAVPGAPSRPTRPASEQNLRVVECFREQADARNVTPAQLAFAWVLAQGKHIVPLVGTRRRERLNEALGALEITLTAEDLAQIEEAVPPDAVGGSLYSGFVLQMIQQERSR